MVDLTAHIRPPFSSTERYLIETVDIINSLDPDEIEQLAESLGSLQGRLFVLGNGGSAATASHAVNDFRKMCGIEAYYPTDNVAELTARANDDGWEFTFSDWLGVAKPTKKDALLILSVGGGDSDTSRNLVEALYVAELSRMPIYGIVGRDGGFTAKHAKVCVVIPPLFPDRVTPHTEGICSVVLHLLVSHPAMAQ